MKNRHLGPKSIHARLEKVLASLNDSSRLWSRELFQPGFSRYFLRQMGLEEICAQFNDAEVMAVHRILPIVPHIAGSKDGISWLLEVFLKVRVQVEALAADLFCSGDEILDSRIGRLGRMRLAHDSYLSGAFSASDSAFSILLGPMSEQDHDRLCAANWIAPDKDVASRLKLLVGLLAPVATGIKWKILVDRPTPRRAFVLAQPDHCRLGQNTYIVSTDKSSKAVMSSGKAVFRGKKKVSTRKKG